MARLSGLALLLLLGGAFAIAAPQETPANPDQSQEAQAEGENQAAELDPDDPANQSVPDYDPEPADPGQLPGERSLWGLFLSALGSLLVVIGLILLLAWLAKRFLPNHLTGAGQGEGRLKLLQSLPLGQRRFVTLVEVDGKRFLLGVAEQQVTLLKALDDPSFGQELAGVDAPKTVQELWEEEQR